MSDIKYTIQSGSLPVGVTLDEETGSLEGDIDFVNLGLGPQWINPPAGSLGEYDEDETVSFNLNARLDNNQRALLGIVNNGKDYLPWGLKLNPVTGELSGTIADLLPSQVSQAENRNGPIWQTQFGKLFDYEVGATASLQITANGRNNKTVRDYSIIEDGLPWGLRLNNSTGAITGTVAELKAPGLTIEVPKLPAPVWNTARGSLGVFDENQEVSILISATPAEGRTISKYTVRSSSGLPWGLRLNFTTGLISGVIADVRTVIEPGFYDATKDPSIDQEVTINGNLVSVNTSLGVLTKGQAFSAQFSATPASNRTISHWTLKSGNLPFGLKLSRSGLISGTVSNVNHVELRTYQFTVEVFDNQLNRVSRDFALTIQ